MKFTLPGVILLLAMVKMLFIELVGRQKVLPINVMTKMKNAIVQNATDFVEVCKANIHCVTTHIMEKEQLQGVENLDLWSVSLEVKGIFDAHVVVMNTDRVLRIWHMVWT